MPALFSVSALFLVFSAAIYVGDYLKNQKKNREAWNALAFIGLRLNLGYRLSRITS